MILEALFAAAVAWVLQRAVRQYQAFHRLDDAAGPGEHALSVIVPVRNEQENIGACLDTLTAQKYAGPLEILVVDDDSTDATWSIAGARSHGGVRVMRAGPLPEGWTGKCHACWQGASAATGEYLCFIDADVRARPELLRRAVGHAAAQRIDMLSLSPLQEMGTWSERLILPAGFLLLAATQDLRRVNDPRASAAAANGQFILIRRNAYIAVGGHAAVRSAVAEDGALAARVKAAGDRAALLDGSDLLRVRMYHSLPQLWEGLAKNIPQMLQGLLPATWAAALACAFAGAATALPALATIALLRQPTGTHIAAAALAWAATLALLGMHIGIARRFRFPVLYAFLFPIGYVLGAALVLTSVFRHLRGAVSWKGRTYDPSPDRSPGPSLDPPLDFRSADGMAR